MIPRGPPQMFSGARLGRWRGTPTRWAARFLANSEGPITRAVPSAFGNGGPAGRDLLLCLGKA